MTRRDSRTRWRAKDLWTGAFCQKGRVPLGRKPRYGSDAVMQHWDLLLGFHLAVDTLPSGVLPRNSTFFLSPASEELPPLSDMAPLIRAPEGLQPS